MPLIYQVSQNYQTVVEEKVVYWKKNHRIILRKNVYFYQNEYFLRKNHFFSQNVGKNTDLV